MKLTPSQRVSLKSEIAKRLSDQEYSEIDLLLEEFGISTNDLFQGGKFDYVISMMKGVGDKLILELAEHLNIETGSDSVLEPPAFWTPNQLRVFLSHLAAHKIFASELQNKLANLGISSFVAHEDIEPDAEWQLEIENGLRTCDGLVAILHENFNESTWTDQEVGYALGRGVPVFSIRLGMAPYGLFGKKQAFNGNGKTATQIAMELFSAYNKHPKTRSQIADTIVDLFCGSTSFAEAKSRCDLLEQLEHWDDAYGEKLSSAAKTNSQIRDSWGVPGRIRALVAKNELTEGSAVTDYTATS